MYLKGLVVNNKNQKTSVAGLLEVLFGQSVLSEAMAILLRQEPIRSRIEGILAMEVVSGTDPIVVMGPVPFGRVEVVTRIIAATVLCASQEPESSEKDSVVIKSIQIWYRDRNETISLVTRHGLIIGLLEGANLVSPVPETSNYYGWLLNLVFELSWGTGRGLIPDHMSGRFSNEVAKFVKKVLVSHSPVLGRFLKKVVKHHRPEGETYPSGLTEQVVREFFLKINNTMSEIERMKAFGAHLMGVNEEDADPAPLDK